MDPGYLSLSKSKKMKRFPHITFLFLHSFIVNLRGALFSPVVNFINILQAAFAPIFFHQKIKKQNCN